MKAVFLDVDGVLNNQRTEIKTKSGYKFVDYYLIERLKEIIDATDAVVVLSSDWRYGLVTKRQQPDLIELQDKLKKFGIEIYGYTPITYDEDGEIIKHAFKGREIDRFLQEHNEIDRFIIIDDDRLNMAPYIDHLVQTNYRVGLTDELVQCAIDMLITK